MVQKIKILVVDDDGIIALSLKTILEAGGQVTVSALGNNGEQAIQLYAEYQPDILLMDIQMQPVDGLTAAANIRRTYPDAKILFLTTFKDDEYILKALEVGAKGYILKQDFEGILPALLAVQSGQSVFGGEIISRLPAISHSEENIFAARKCSCYKENNISEKELEIIRLVADGRSNKEIAAALFLSEGTVRNYLSVILDKLNLRDRTQLAVYYYKHL